MKGPEIQNPNHLHLYPRDEEILKKMFVGYERIIIEAEFKGGFTPSRVFLIRPFREGQSELRTVVKSAPAYLIQKEEQAYQTYIHNRLPRASELHRSIYLDNWAGLRYQLEGEGIIYLIDFADARRDHRLHDLLRLETEVITQLLPLILNRANLAAANLLPEAIYHLHEQLHRATFQLPPTQPELLSPILEKPFAIQATIRQEAYFYLYNPENFAEYYHPLTIYLLGAMKFKNLDRQAKEVAFWSAGAVQQLLQNAAASPDQGFKRKKPSGVAGFERLKTDTMFWPKDGKEMIRIPAGEFVYGGAKIFTPFSNSIKTLPGFWIDKTPVTNAEYYRFVSETGYKPPDHWRGQHTLEKIANHPVTGVSWEDVTAYARWANKRLPTEQEWEKAARGSEGQIYPWGNHSPTPELCNFDQNEGGTTPVGKYSSQGDSPYGCVDMVGNVWEWTLSSEDLLFLKVKVFRGGSWFTSGRYLQAAHRNFAAAKTRPHLVGFRCVVVLNK